MKCTVLKLTIIAVIIIVKCIDAQIQNPLVAYTLSVRSENPTYNVFIAYNPPDLNGNSSNTTPFNINFNSGTNVVVSAVPSVGNNVFVKWKLDGNNNYSTNTTTTVSMNANHTLTAVYESSPNQLFLAVTPTTTQTLDWGQSVNYTCTVTDQNGAPVAGAGVGGYNQLISNAFITTTNSSGVAYYQASVPQGLTNGTYSISFNATKTNYISSTTLYRYITVVHQNAPIANFSGSPTNGNAPLLVTFTDQSTGTITSRTWNFGDGGTSTLQNPTHNYTTSGNYTVSLSVYGPGGSDTETKNNYITVNQNVPVANFIGAPTNGNAPLLVTFTDQSTGTITSRTWNFGDGGTSSLQNPTHTYNTTGTYTVSLTVNGPGGSDNETKQNYITVTQQLASLTVGNLVLKGNQITGTSPNYTVSGNVSIKHVNQTDELIRNLNATLTCNTSTNVINVISGGATFQIMGNQGWIWDFSQMQNWNFSTIAGEVSFSGRIRLDLAGTYISSNSYKLNFFNRTIVAISNFGGNTDLEKWGTININIDLTTVTIGFNVSTGANFRLGIVRLGILEESLGISLNVLSGIIRFDADIGDLLTLDFVGVDGAEFTFSPFGSISLGVEWNYPDKRLTFYKDTEISLIHFKELITDEEYKSFLQSNRIHYGIGDRKNQLLFDVGLRIKQGSFIDFNDFILDGEATLDIKWHNKFKVSAAKVKLTLNYQESFIYGQILMPGIKVAQDIDPNGWFNSLQNEISLKFDWGNNTENRVTMFQFIGKFRGAVIPFIWLFPSLDIDVKSVINQTSPKLDGSLRACINIPPFWQFCAGASVKMDEKGVRIAGIPIYGLKTLNEKSDVIATNDTITMLADPYSNTLTGEFINKKLIPLTNIEANPHSKFNLIINPSATNYGDLHLSTIIDGTSLSWNLRNNAGQINASISNFQGLSLALASAADLKLQSNQNPSRFIEIKNNGGIIISHFIDGFSYYSPYATSNNNRTWKIIRIYPEDTTETFVVKVKPVDTDTLLFTLIKSDPTHQGRILYARYYTEEMDSTDYNLEIIPNVMNFSFTNGNEIIGPNSLDNIAVENGLLYLSQIYDSWTETSFRIKWKTSVPTNRKVQYGPTITTAIYNQSSNQLSSEHEVFIPRSAVDSGWVYQLQCTNVDSERVYSEWRIIYPGITTSIKEIVNMPMEFSLDQNYPNPFNPSTKIKYTIPKQSYVNLTIYDMLGRTVNKLVAEEKATGYYEVDFDASRLANGIYFYRMQAGEYVETKKMVLMK